MAFAETVLQAMLITYANTINIYAFHFAKTAIKGLSMGYMASKGFGRFIKKMSLVF